MDERETLLRYHSSLGTSRESTSRVAQPDLMATYRRRLVATDASIVVASMILGLAVSSRASSWAIDPVVAVYGMPPILGALWLALLALRGAYDRRIVGIGTEEIRRIVSATLLTFAVVAGFSYLFRADISRAYAFISLPVGLVLLVVGRFAWRDWLYRARRRGLFMHRTVVVGSEPGASELVNRLEHDSYAGYLVVGTYGVPEGDVEPWLTGLDALLDRVEASALALAPSQSVTSETVHQVAWHLEERQVDLLIAPAILDLTGPRLSVRPAAGLPLLHLDRAVLSRPQAFAKRSLDLFGATILSLLLLPVFLACAVAVRLSSKGPVIFRQPRIGAGGRSFTMLKFRTMIDGADGLREELRAGAHTHDPTFKLANDPRVTPVGRFLRRWSLDELPQLWNVIAGSMSLVGPRPHPLDDVSRYELSAYHRLALKPGLTGLWQVAGRSDLGWNESLELDLHYVETWTLSGDLVLLARTVRAVIQGRGAS